MILDFFFFTGTGAALSDDLCLVLILIFLFPQLSHTPAFTHPRAEKTAPAYRRGRSSLEFLFS